MAHEVNPSLPMPEGTPAELYEEFAVPAIMAPCAARLIEYARPRPGQRVLDVATGTGIVARLVAPRVAPGGRVVGLDAHQERLDIARRVAPPEYGIEWRAADAQAIPFDDVSFDLVLCQHGLQFFPDRVAALREARRVLVDGGQAVFAVWQGLGQHPIDAALSRALSEQLMITLEHQAVPFVLGDREQTAALFVSAGFRIDEFRPVNITGYFPGGLARLVQVNVVVYALTLPWLRGLDEAGKLALVDRILQAIAPELEPFVEGDMIRMPKPAWFITARRE